MRDKIRNNIRDENVDELRRELEEFRAEKEKIRQLVGQIGGTQFVKHDKKINLIFLSIIVMLFIFDILRHIFNIPISSLPPIISVEVAVMLVSIKIVWMIHKQTRVEHFQFHILNSLEFRLNELSKQIRELHHEQMKG
jgi:hypothetical protein